MRLCINESMLGKLGKYFYDVHIRFMYVCIYIYTHTHTHIHTCGECTWATEWLELSLGAWEFNTGEENIP